MQLTVRIIISFTSPTHSFIPGLKPSFSANPSHCSLSFSSLGLTTCIPQTFTVSSEHICFYFLLFLFYLFFMPSVLWRCWLGGRKGIQPVKTEWWGAGVVICLEQGADLHMAQLMPLPLTVSCFSKSRLVLPFWYRLTRVIPGQRAVKHV